MTQELTHTEDAVLATVESLLALGLIAGASCS